MECILIKQSSLTYQVYKTVVICMLYKIYTEKNIQTADKIFLVMSHRPILTSSYNPTIIKYGKPCG